MDTLCEQSLETTDSSTETAIETGSHCTGVGHKFSFTEKKQNNFPRRPQMKQDHTATSAVLATNRRYSAFALALFPCFYEKQLGRARKITASSSASLAALPQIAARHFEEQHVQKHYPALLLDFLHSSWQAHSSPNLVLLCCCKDKPPKCIYSPS